MIINIQEQQSYLFYNERFSTDSIEEDIYFLLHKKRIYDSPIYQVNRIVFLRGDIKCYQLRI